MDSVQLSFNFAAPTTIEPFNRLVKLAARAFFDDDSSQPLAAAAGGVIPVVVLDALTRRHWVREDDFAKDLKLSATQLRRTLRLLEDCKFITRVNRKERAKSYRIDVGEENARVKLHTHSYCCLDYSQIHDVLRYGILSMRKSLGKDKVKTVQEYECPNCHKKYTALDASKLISMVDFLFHCQLCDGELEVAESEKPTHASGDMLEKMEAQLKPLTEQLDRVKDLPVPEFVDLQAWEAQARATAASGSGYRDSSKVVEVAFDGVEVKEEKVQSDKVLPPWMIKQGMNLTKEQRGEVEEDTKPTTLNGDDDKKSTLYDDNDDKKSAADKERILKEEYIKSYYAAVFQKQQELEALKASDSREVGMKSKREDDDDDDDLDWEEG